MKVDCPLEQPFSTSSVWTIHGLPYRHHSNRADIVQKRFIEGHYPTVGSEANGIEGRTEIEVGIRTKRNGVQVGFEATQAQTQQKNGR